jgi:hypothetical protein
MILVRPKDSKKRGRYVFRFFKEGEWTSVEIDDRLPCDEFGNLIFGRCADKNELWVPLLEKAYAKLYGSYQQLSGGHVMNAIVDMTGGVSQITKITADMAQNNEMWDKLQYQTDNGSYMIGVCSIGIPEKQLEESGLLGGHAYAVLEAKKTSSGIRLIRIRNPWGHGEWKLKWSDDDKQSWTDDVIKELHVKFGDDGEFWMEYSDFCKYWTQLDSVRLFNDPNEKIKKGLQPTGEKEWALVVRKGEWNESSAGGLFSSNSPTSANNPQYIFNLSQDSDLCISLMQYDFRYDGDDKEEDFPIGFHILKYQGTPYDANNPTAADRASVCTSDRVVLKSKFEYSREVIVDGQLKAGTYIVIPSTYYPDLKSKFILRVYAKTAKHNIQLTHLPPADYLYRKTTVDGEWIMGKTAGGCQNTWKWILNRQYKLRITPGNNEDAVQVNLILTQQRDPKELYYIGAYIIETNPQDENAPVHDLKKIHDIKFTSLRESSSVLNIKTNTSYVVIPATFNPDESAKFSLTASWRRDVYPQTNIDIAPIGENYGYKNWTIESEWKGLSAGGCPNCRDTWMNNPKIMLTIKNSGFVDIMLMQEEKTDDKLAGVGFHVFNENNTVVAATDTWHFTKLAVKSAIELQPGKYKIMPSTFYKDQERKFTVRVTGKDFVIESLVL